MASDGNQRLNEGELLRSMYHYLPGKGDLYCASLERGVPPEGATAARSAQQNRSSSATGAAAAGQQKHADAGPGAKDYARGTWYGQGATGKGLPTYDHKHEDHRGKDGSPRSVALTGGLQMPMVGLALGGAGGAAAGEVTAALGALSGEQGLLLYVEEGDAKAAEALAEVKENGSAFVVAAVTTATGESAETAARALLKRLGRSSVDVLVAVGEVASAARWAELAGLVEAGLAKALGVAVEDEAQLSALMAAAPAPAPVLNAAPLGPRAARRRLVGLCRRHRMALLATRPMGEAGTDAALPQVAEVAQRFGGGLSPQRLLVKWSAQRGVASVASKADEVAGLWDFMLAMDDKAVIDGLM